MVNFFSDRELREAREFPEGRAGAPAVSMTALSQPLPRTQLRRQADEERRKAGTDEAAEPETEAKQPQIFTDDTDGRRGA